jgi:hypothetical protein
MSHDNSFTQHEKINFHHLKQMMAERHSKLRLNYPGLDDKTYSEMVYATQLGVLGTVLRAAVVLTGIATIILMVMCLLAKDYNTIKPAIFMPIILYWGWRISGNMWVFTYDDPVALEDANRVLYKKIISNGGFEQRIDNLSSVSGASTELPSYLKSLTPMRAGKICFGASGIIVLLMIAVSGNVDITVPLLGLLMLSLLGGVAGMSIGVLGKLKSRRVN